MGGGPADERLEGGELAGQLVADGAAVLERDPPAVEVPVQADAELGMLARQLRRLLTGPPGDHQARTGDDPVDMGVENAPVDALRGPEVVGVDHQHSRAFRGRPAQAPASSRSRARTVSASKYSSASSLAARLCRG